MQFRRQVHTMMQIDIENHDAIDTMLYMSYRILSLLSHINASNHTMSCRYGNIVDEAKARWSIFSAMVPWWTYRHKSAIHR
jgi:hypothetical protein